MTGSVGELMKPEMSDNTQEREQIHLFIKLTSEVNESQYWLSLTLSLAYQEN